MIPNQPVFPKLDIRTLPIVDPPIPLGGGRLLTPAGELTQVINGKAFEFAAYITFDPQSRRPRGNHYHARKTETLYVISGELEALYQDLDTHDQLSLILHGGDIVTISPRCVHAYRAIEYSQGLEFSNESYDPRDTFPYPILKGD
jgi:quercetin dioxygenase-like cupin family protein